MSTDICETCGVELSTDECLDCTASAVRYLLLDGFVPAFLANALGLPYAGPRQEGEAMVRLEAWLGDKRVARIIVTHDPHRRDYRQLRYAGLEGAGAWTVACRDRSGNLLCMVASNKPDAAAKLAVCKMVRAGVRLGDQIRPVPFVAGKAPSAVDPEAFCWIDRPSVEFLAT